MKNLRNKSRQTVAKNQDHQCPKCGESLYNGEELHLHHVKPTHRGRVRKSHARFLGEGREVTLEPYPTSSHRLKLVVLAGWVRRAIRGRFR